MRARVPRPSSLRARMMFLFGLLVTIPLTVAGALLSLTGYDSVLSAGVELSRVGEGTFSQSTDQLARLATRGTDRAARQLMEIGRDQLTRLGREQARLNEEGLREYGQRLSTTATDTLRGSTESMAHAGGMVIARSSSELRRLQSRAVGDLSTALIREARSAFQETGDRLVEANTRQMIDVVQELNLERARRVAEQTHFLLTRTQEMVRQVTARPPGRMPPPALFVPATEGMKGGRGAGAKNLDPSPLAPPAEHRPSAGEPPAYRPVLERVVQGWSTRLRQTLPVPLLSARLYLPSGEWIPPDDAADPPDDERSPTEARPTVPGNTDAPARTEAATGSATSVIPSPAPAAAVAPAAIALETATLVAQSGREQFVVLVSPQDPIPRAIFFVPVVSLGAARSVFVVQVSLDILTREVSRALIGESARAPAFVASLADSQILAHSDPRRRGTRALPEEQDLLAAARRQSLGTMLATLPGVGPALCAFATVGPQPPFSTPGATPMQKARVPRRPMTDDRRPPTADRQEPGARSQEPEARNAPSTQHPAPSTPSAGDPNWVVVALQPLDEVLAKTTAMQATIREAAREAADTMEDEARQRASALVVAAVSEQQRIAADASARIHQENRARVATAVRFLSGQHRQIATATQQRLQSRSRTAAAVARARMLQQARITAAQATEALRAQTGRSAKTGLMQMQQLTFLTASAASARILRHSLWLIVIFLAIALLSAIITTRSLARPISALAAGTAAIARGDFSGHVPVQSRDELGALAVAFNEMADAVQQGRSDLEASNTTLAREKSRIQAIVQSSPDGLAIVDADDRVTFLNPSARELLHLPPEATETLTFPALRRSLSDATVSSLEDWAADPSYVEPRDLVLDAPHRVLQVRCVPIAGESGARLDGDRAAQSRLLHLHDVTREREIDEMKSSFVALVSHELRTPLTSILGFSSYMLTGKLGSITEPQRTGLESIHRQANRLKAIIADFLDLARIEAGAVAIPREPVRLADVSLRVMEELRPQAMEKGIYVHFSAPHPGDADTVGLADEPRLAQILTNLLGNAIKFTESGGRVTVEITREEGRGLVRIRDTGMGIPEEELPRIFDRFYQVEKVATRKAGGTGLGLSIVKSIIEAMGGTVSVDSRLGEGTCFTVSLPLEVTSDESGA